MTPEQKVKSKILAVDAGYRDETIEVTAENVDRLYARLVNDSEHWDAMNEVREGEVETGIPCDWSRHYESKSVAAKMPDGSWVGWTYWYGGGKHGCPEEVSWIDGAYDLDCKEEEKLVVIQTFTKRGPSEDERSKPALSSGEAGHTDAAQTPKE